MPGDQAKREAHSFHYVEPVSMPRGLIKLIGFLLLVGSVGVAGVQGCTSSKDPKTLGQATKTNG